MIEAMHGIAACIHEIKLISPSCMRYVVLIRLTLAHATSGIMQACTRSSHSSCTARVLGGAYLGHGGHFTDCCHNCERVTRCDSEEWWQPAAQHYILGKRDWHTCPPHGKHTPAHTHHVTHIRSLLGVRSAPYKEADVWWEQSFNNSAQKRGMSIAA